MQPLEGLYLVTVAGALVAHVAPARWRLRGVAWPGVALIALAAQLVVEGYRWPIFAAYVVGGPFCAGSLAVRILGPRRTKDRPRRRLDRVRSGLAAVLALLTLVASGALAALYPVFELPQPTGPHRVGVTWLYVEDPSRPEVYTPDPSDHRELMVEVWYPATPAPGAAPAPYEDRADVIGPARATLMSWLVGFPFSSRMVDHHERIPTHSFRNAPMSTDESRYPVLVFSHGYALGGTRTNTVLMEELASHGYVVASIAHTYQTPAVVFPDGRVRGFDMDAILRIQSGELESRHPEEYAWTEDPIARDQLIRRFLKDQVGAASIIGVWTADTQSVLAELTRISTGDRPSLLAGRLDLGRVGVLGMSFGGAAAGHFCVVDPRCSAGLNLDGFQYGDLADAVLEVPFMIFYSDRDGIPMNEFLYRHAAGPAYQLTVRGSEHGNFTDVSISIPLLRWIHGRLGEIDGPHMLRLMNAYSLAFFDRYLRDRPSELLEGPSDDFPEVEFESRNTAS